SRSPKVSVATAICDLGAACRRRLQDARVSRASVCVANLERRKATHASSLDTTPEAPERQRAARAALPELRFRLGSAALERGLHLAAGAELRHRRRRDVDALSGARIHTLARGAVRSRELAEPREVDRVAALERLGHGLHEGVDGLAGVAGREAALRRDLVDEV